MNKPIRVFWYCEKWQPGGIQKVQANLLRYFRADEFRFDVVVSQKETELLDKALSDCGARMIVTLDRRYGGPARRTLHNIFAVRRVIRSGAYDVAHFNVCHGVELIYSFWAWLYGVPVRIAHCRNNDIGAGGKMRRVKIAAHRLCRRLFGRCTNVHLANSDLAGQWLFSDGRYRVLKNGVDAEAFRFDPQRRDEERRRLGLEDAFVVGHVGHFNYQKNHEFLVQIFDAVQRRRADARLLLVGTGEGEARVRSQIEALGIVDKVVFYGATNDVPPAMWAMDAFVFPSRFEGFGNVLIEAQAAGLRCYASEGVIPREVCVTEDFSWLPLDAPAKQWADALLNDCGAPRPDSAGALERIRRAGYDLADMAAELKAIYRGGR